MELSIELKALLETLEHNITVQKNLGKLSSSLEARSTTHDASKLSLDEFEGFVGVKLIARKFPYGSKQYEESLKDNKAIELHFSRNPHHPEHYPNGMADMSLLDIIEMVCDWKATNEVRLRKQATEISWEDSLGVQRKRFDLTDSQMWLIRLIAKEIE